MLASIALPASAQAGAPSPAPTAALGVVPVTLPDDLPADAGDALDFLTAEDRMTVPVEIAGAGRRPRAGHVKLDHAAAARLLATEDPAVVDVAATGAGWVVDRAREDGVEVCHGARS